MLKATDITPGSVIMSEWGVAYYVEDAYLSGTVLYADILELNADELVQKWHTNGDNGEAYGDIDFTNLNDETLRAALYDGMRPLSANVNVNAEGFIEDDIPVLANATIATNQRRKQVTVKHLEYNSGRSQNIHNPHGKTYYHATFRPHWENSHTGAVKVPMIHAGTFTAAVDRISTLQVTSRAKDEFYIHEIILTDDAVMDESILNDMYDKWHISWDSTLHAGSDAFHYVNDVEAPGSISLYARADRITVVKTHKFATNDFDWDDIFENLHNIRSVSDIESFKRHRVRRQFVL